MKCINCMRFSIFRIRLSFNFTMFTNVCEYPLSYSTYIFSKGQYQPLCFCIHIWPKILNVKFSIQEQEPEHGNSDLPRASTLPVLLQKPHPNCPPTVIALQELYAHVTSHFHQLGLNSYDIKFSSLLALAQFSDDSMSPCSSSQLFP